MENCLFCKIVKGDIPSYKIYEDDKCICFLDISQATLGHCLVVSKSHYSNLLEVDDETLKHMSLIVKKISKGMSKINNIKGFNILNNCNEISGQSIMHFHIHIIPRYEADEMTIKSNKENKLTSEEFITLLEKIKNEL